MALLWADGFDDYGPPGGTDQQTQPHSILLRYYPVVDTGRNRIRPGRFGGGALGTNFSMATLLRTRSLTTDPLLIIGLAVFRDKAGTIAPFQLYSEDDLGMNVIVGPRTIEIHKGTTLINKIPEILSTDRWYFLEFKVYTHPTDGYYELRVDGREVDSASEIDTGTGYHDAVGFRSFNVTGASWRADDFYICDGTGSHNNDFLGNIRTISRRPTGEHTANFTTVEPVGDHYAAVNEEVCDDDDSYIEGVDGDKDLYEYEDVDSNFNIKGVQLITMAQVTGTDYFDLHFVTRQNGVEYEHEMNLTSPSWFAKSWLSETNPATDAIWQVGEFNSAQFGLWVEEV